MNCALDENGAQGGQVAAVAGATTAQLVLRLSPIFIAAVTTAVFLPALRNGFVNWDDYELVIENPHYRGLGWAQLRWMFTTLYMGHYEPLTWLTFALDYFFWRLDPFGYHLTSLMLHAANAVLFYFLAERLLSRSAPSRPEPAGIKIAAAFSALLFAVHRLRVESVVWVTERRDVLSGFFFLSILLCYLKAVTGERNFLALLHTTPVADAGNRAERPAARRRSIQLPLMPRLGAACRRRAALLPARPGRWKDRKKNFRFRSGYGGFASCRVGGLDLETS